MLFSIIGMVVLMLIGAIIVINYFADKTSGMHKAAAVEELFKEMSLSNVFKLTELTIIGRVAYAITYITFAIMLAFKPILIFKIKK